jgi:hypothetical protein
MYRLKHGPLVGVMFKVLKKVLQQVVRQLLLPAQNVAHLVLFEGRALQGERLPAVLQLQAPGRNKRTADAGHNLIRLLVLWLQLVWKQQSAGRQEGAGS